jgi:hypothetical protein
METEKFPFFKVKGALFRQTMIKFKLDLRIPLPYPYVKFELNGNTVWEKTNGN